MRQVDMSPKAVTARLKRVAQLRRLCLSLGQAKLPLKQTQLKVSESRPKTTQPEGKSAK